MLSPYQFNISCFKFYVQNCDFNLNFNAQRQPEVNKLGEYLVLKHKGINENAYILKAHTALFTALVIATVNTLRPLEIAKRTLQRTHLGCSTQHTSKRSSLYSF
jgi:hypothetical protein